MIRGASFFEIPTIASICAAAFFEEHLFGPTMHPHRHEYPDDFTYFWYGLLRKDWADWRKRMFVAITKEEGTGGEKIVGLAVWQRQGKGNSSMGLARFDPRNLLGPLINSTTTLPNALYPNRAANPAKLDILQRGLPFCAHHWLPQPDEPYSRAENWYLSLLAVHPNFQGHGFGQELVAWGLREADEEGICASVLSSSGTDAFYLHCGFDEKIGEATEGEENPLKGVEGGSILFRWPKKG